MMDKGLLAFVLVVLWAGPAIPGIRQEQAIQSAPDTPSQSDGILPEFPALFAAGPLSDPRPPSTILPAGATTVELTLQASTPVTCRYSVGRSQPWDKMTPFDDQMPSTSPQTVVRGLDPDPTVVNEVYVCSDAAPSTVLHLQYRCLPAAKPDYPRTANLWGYGWFVSKGMAYASRIDLWLGADFSAGQVRELRQKNPHCLLLCSSNTVENNHAPDSYFLRDTTGRKIEVWPGIYRLNLTRPEVAEYQARYAYQKMIDSGLMYDGCFFDNFMTTQSWLTQDIYGRPVKLDADGDGKADDKDALDKAWRQGVFHELREWRKLMPWALASGHVGDYPDPETAEIFNGQGIGFATTDAIEGKKPFEEVWDLYHAWCADARQPAITSVESAVPDQIAYGYDYSPKQHTPASTWDFARDYCPYMRFGLAFTLMNNGYFSHDLGDREHGQDWWYDELDYNLGTPLGAAERIGADPGTAGGELLANGGFESNLTGSWTLWSKTATGNAALVTRDLEVKHGGSASACINLTSAGGKYGVEFTQWNRSLTQGKTYTVTFWALTSDPMDLTIKCTKGTANWDSCGLNATVRLTTQWQRFSLTFQGKITVQDARLQFLLGGQTGQVWLDDVSLKERVEAVYRRDFQYGVALLNGTRQRRTVDLGDLFLRLQGPQAPKYQYILDDTAEAGFKTTGQWQEVDLGTTESQATAPFYHAWNNRCHKRFGGTGEATWDLALRGPGKYTIQAWWAAAPDAAGWTKQAAYEVIAGGKVLAGATLDQSRAGDQWHTIVTGLSLDPQTPPSVRLRTGSSGTLVADALHIFSAERYNDGQAVQQVTLEPMDGIILRRIETDNL
jgi:hypothetical protein